MTTAPSPSPDAYAQLRDALINRRPLDHGQGMALLMILASLDSAARLLDETGAEDEANYPYRAGICESVVDTFRREMTALAAR